MNKFETVNILDMINAIGEEELQFILSDFFCPKNHEIEQFVRKNAIEFAKRKMSITYLVIDGEGRIVGIFTLTHKAVQLFQRQIGGGVVYLECEDKPKLLSFYQNNENRYQIFGDRYSVRDSVKYIQLMKII